MTGWRTLTLNTDTEELWHVRDRWGMYVVAGLVLVVLGFIALGSIVVATLASVVVFGALLVVAGLAQVGSAFTARGWSGFLLHVLFGILALVVGVSVIASPVPAAVTLTLFLAVFFLIGGLFRVVSAGVLRFANWGWAMFGGAVSVVLGIVLFAQWPEASLWLIGLLVGIELVIEGIAWLTFGLAARSRGRALAPAIPTAAPAPA
jgi:uncharacterized membrane protein HdeD (DUF308 family)